MSVRFFWILFLCLIGASLFVFADEEADMSPVAEEEEGEQEEAQQQEATCEDNAHAEDFCAEMERITDDRRGCNGFVRSMSSAQEKKTIVFKLLENLWHNCPQTCFSCDLHSSPRVGAALISDSEQFLENRITDETLSGKVMKHSAEVDIDRWLEVNAVLEHMFVCENAEDAAQQGNSNSTICEKWRDELKTTEFVAVTTTRPDNTTVQHCADVGRPDNADAIATYNLPPSLKDGMHWWCRETCKLCARQKDIVDHHFFSF